MLIFVLSIFGTPVTAVLVYSAVIGTGISTSAIQGTYEIIKPKP